MPVPISVILGLPSEQESVANGGAQVCNNLRIVDGLNPVFWSAVFQNVHNGYHADSSHVLEKAAADQASDEELEMVGSTPEDVVYGTPKKCILCPPVCLSSGVSKDV